MANNYAEALDLQMTTSSLLRNNRYTKDYTNFMLGPLTNAHKGGFRSEHLGHNLKNSHTYFVTEEMCDLIGWAWRDMPPHPVEPEHLPSPYGWAWLEKPYVISDVNDQPVSYRAIQWMQATSGGKKGIAVVLYGDRDVMTEKEWENFVAGESPDKADLFVKYVGRVHVVHVLSWGYGLDWSKPESHEFISLHEREDIDYEESLRSHRESFGWLTAFWAIASQELGRPEVVEPPRPHRKRAAREGKRETTINVMHVRRRASGDDHDEASTDGTKRKMTVKTYVKPFWRRQWYPKQEVHRLILIPPHVRGPADAPWSKATTVRVVDR